ncbi:MAG TPA: NUDIX domain-containing protein [Candidatus Saccharibacteria bacterium]|jgi:8-oxo-dGTP pyrophosphatase MutT (NUDIX family)|nr:NUDIX domain-containing protein [Candidatus Saccharibacteria bacterium]
MISYYASDGDPYNVASGGVVYSSDQVLLLSRIDEGRKTYHLPKGTLEPGESLEACSKREILEESGATVDLEYYLGAISAEFIGNGKSINKVTHYYAAKLKSEDLQPMDSEHSGREWVSISEAQNLLKLNDNPKREWLIIKRLERWIALQG